MSCQGPRDDVVIAERFSELNILSDQPVSINSIDSAASLSISRNAFNLGDDQSDMSRIGGSLTLSSNLEISGSLVIDGSLEWTRGTLLGKGKTIVNGGTEIKGSSTKTVFGPTLELDSDTVWSQGALNISSGGSIRNSAGHTFEFRGDLGMRTANSGTFQNDGILLRSAGQGNAAWNVHFHNSAGASVHVSSGTLWLSHTSTNAGTYDISATVLFSGGPHQQKAGSSVVGSGTTRLQHGTFLIDSTLDIDTALSLSDPSARLTVDGALTVNGPWTWTAGQLTGSGTTTAQGGLTLTQGTEKIVVSHQLDLASDTLWENGSFRQIGSSAVRILDEQTFDIRGDLTASGDQGTFINHGNIIRSSGDGLANLAIDLQNMAGATVAIDSGTLQLSETSTNEGNLDIDA